MITFRQARLSVMAVVLGVTASSSLIWPVAYAETATPEAAKKEVVRPEISKIITAAQVFFDAKNYPAALVKIAETDAIANKNSYETYAVERTRANFYMASAQKENAAKAFELALNTHYLSPIDQRNMMQAISLIYFQLSNYPLTISWMDKYIADGGADTKAKTVLNQAHYLNKDYALAYKGISEEILNDINAGRIPSEQNLKLVMSCAAILNDDVATLKAVEQLNSYFPTSKNWLYLLNQVHFKPGFPDRMFLDIYRLKVSLGLMNVASEMVEMAEFATRAGLPGEAKKILDMGFSAGLLDKGPDAKKHAALLDAATKRAADDLKTMPQGEAGANASKAGTGLVNLGMAYATSGQYAKGAALIEQGINKGGVERLEEAKLHLGVVYFWDGKKEEAIKQLLTVQGNDGVKELAKFWIMQINHPLVSGT